MADPLFRALARPQMVAGVTYPFFVLNGIVAADMSSGDTVDAWIEKIGLSCVHPGG